MKNQSIIAQLRTALPQFNWISSDESYHGKLKQDVITKVINKDTHKFGGINIFISGPMYPGTKKDFTYITCYQNDTVRQYRCRNSYLQEHGKMFISGKTTQKAVDNFIKDFDIKNYVMA